MNPSDLGLPGEGQLCLREGEGFFLGGSDRPSESLMKSVWALGRGVLAAVLDT